MLVFQLFQHVRIGGVAGLGLLHHRQPQGFKQQLSQLLGGIDIELFSGISVNDFLTVCNPLGKHLPEGLQKAAIHADAPLLHPIQNSTQGQFDFLIQSPHFLFLQLFLEYRSQMPHGFRAARSVPVIQRSSQEIGCHL